MVSQWPPVFPTWSNLVQVDIQPKHPDPATLHRGSSTKVAHRGWLCIAQGAIYKSYNPAENIGKQLRKSENIYGISKNI